MSAADSVVIGHGILNRLPAELEAKGLNGALFMITDTTVGRRFSTDVEGILQRSGRKISTKQVPPGERAKSLQQAADLYDWLVASGAERGDTILALGGGVIGDLAGYVAATFLRGVKWAQVATTLLAQVDSSIGGKVGVDLPGGKNLVGSFHTASLSLLDTAMLVELPSNQLAAGWAEVAKTAMIFDRELFDTIERGADQPRDPDLLLHAVRRCVAHKARVVDEDPLDRGPRTILNYGHTIGHAIEASAGYAAYLHGEAVAIGMVGAAAIARELGLLDSEGEVRQNALLGRLGLPLRFTGATPAAVEAAIRIDKKVKDGSPHWVLAQEIGKASYGHVCPSEVERAVIERLYQG